MPRHICLGQGHLEKVINYFTFGQIYFLEHKEMMMTAVVKASYLHYHQKRINYDQP